MAILQPKCGSILRLSPGNTGADGALYLEEGGVAYRQDAVRGEITAEQRTIGMPGKITVILYIVLMAAIIVAVDFLFFRNRFWERLIVNIGIVLVFATFYWRFLKRP